MLKCVSWGQRREIEEDNIDIDMTNHASIQVSEQGSETLNKELGKIRFELNEKREKSKRKLLEKDDWQASRSATKQLSVTCNTWKHRWSLVTGSSTGKKRRNIGVRSIKIFITVFSQNMHPSKPNSRLVRGGI